MFHDIPEGTSTFFGRHNILSSSLFPGDSEEHRGVSRRYGRTCRGGWEATEKMGGLGLKVVELWKNGGGFKSGYPMVPPNPPFLEDFPKPSSDVGTPMTLETTIHKDGEHLRI